MMRNGAGINLHSFFPSKIASGFCKGKDEDGGGEGRRVVLANEFDGIRHYLFIFSI